MSYLTVLAAASLVAFAARSAQAQSPEAAADDPDSLSDQRRTVRAAADDPSHWLPGAVAASSGIHRAAGFGWGGYDGANRNPLFGANVETALGSRLVIGVGITYLAATNLQPAATRSSVVARLQVLDQSRHGIDARVSVGYGYERYSDEEGLLQASLAGGWRSQRTTLLANVGYGQDGEGDDHEGEVRLAGFHRVVGNLHVGLDGRVRKMLRSTDAKTAMGGGAPSLEVTTGAVAALMAGSWAFLVEPGVIAIRRESLRTGAIVVGGVGAVF